MRGTKKVEKRKYVFANLKKEVKKGEILTRRNSKGPMSHFEKSKKIHISSLKNLFPTDTDQEKDEMGHGKDDLDHEITQLNDSEFPTDDNVKKCTQIMLDQNMVSLCDLSDSMKKENNNKKKG